MIPIKNRTKISAAMLLLASSFASNATVVEIRTSLGNIQVNLFDETTPKTVENFLSYVNSGAYASNVVHRSVPGFVIQAGGFSYTGPVEAENGFTLDSVETGDSVMNEPKLSNVRGTIAMAKGSDPDSARSQWFINLADNANSLDRVTNAGGFTVFGQVLGDGMDVADDIASQTIIQYGSPFAQVPIRNYTQSDVDNQVAVTDDNLIVISDIVVIDETVVTHPEIVPTENTLIDAPTSGGGTDNGGSGGGAFGWLIGVAALGLSRYFKPQKLSLMKM
ncbi:peptidylprolyl isomerase [Paraglaciecola aquimarina]|uniref:Peptidyl-prolyl cis-trans isomerase n=1 Tax=Paraglaciecola aquimarina TaxID=1235557 RepID=A0ABU3SSS6_9ALTE|nr:peptidylprolyl isomerase [Paraglaciecola aquimarina]MDU0353072.1 peptidylprolyl isomerase [Paraglaciecola aquimarina]